jgi:hypothetical protein
MVRFAPADAFDAETAAADPCAEGAVIAPKRRARRLAQPSFAPANPLLEQMFPQWARLPTNPADGSGASSEAAFRAGAGLALLDTILRENPPFAGALRQRLALRAATACAVMARYREDQGALRDAEHLIAGGGATSPAGRMHRLWRSFAGRPAGFGAENLRLAADRLELPQGLDLEALAEALRDVALSANNPLAAAAQAASATVQALDSAPRPEAEILAFWLSDLMLAQKFGWDAPMALLATTIARPSSRSSARRPRPGDLDWPLHCSRAYALAAQEAFALAGELSRRSQALLAAQPKLRAKGAGRVIELLLGDDAVSPARAAKLARLSDRATRRLFDRLVALGAVRELSGRPNFRLYGL